MPHLSRHDDVFVLDLGSDENRFHPDWIDAVEQSLREVEQTEGPRALVTTATGKFFSNGLDLEWLAAHRDEQESYLGRVHQLLAHFLTLPVVTVCAVQGHAFAGGAMVTLCHDVRLMRADRGFWCLPEVDLGMAFTPGMTALMRSKLSAQAAHEAMVTGRRYGGIDAQERGIVDLALPEEQLVPTATELAGSMTSKAGRALAAIKAELHPDAVRLLRQGPATTSVPWS